MKKTVQETFSFLFYDSLVPISADLSLKLIEFPYFIPFKVFNHTFNLKDLKMLGQEYIK